MCSLYSITEGRATHMPTTPASRPIPSHRH